MRAQYVIFVSARAAVQVQYIVVCASMWSVLLRATFNHPSANTLYKYRIQITWNEYWHFHGSAQYSTAFRTNIYEQMCGQIYSSQYEQLEWMAPLFPVLCKWEMLWRVAFATIYLIPCITKAYQWFNFWFCIFFLSFWLCIYLKFIWNLTMKMARMRFIEFAFGLWCIRFNFRFWCNGRSASVTDHKLIASVQIQP